MKGALSKLVELVGAAEKGVSQRLQAATILRQDDKRKQRAMQAELEAAHRELKEEQQQRQAAEEEHWAACQQLQMNLAAAQQQAAAAQEEQKATQEELNEVRQQLLAAQVKLQQKVEEMKQQTKLKVEKAKQEFFAVWGNLCSSQDNSCPQE